MSASRSPYTAVAASGMGTRGLTSTTRLSPVSVVPRSSREKSARMTATVMILSIPGSSLMVSQSMTAASPMPTKEFMPSSIFPDGNMVAVEHASARRHTLE